MAVRRAVTILRLLAWPALAALLAPELWSAPAARIWAGLGSPDLIGTVWTWWWTAHALLHGLDPTRCELVYHPVGFFPVAQFNLVDALVAAPFLALGGPVLGTNLATLLLVASNGWAGERLARRAGAGPVGAWVAGAALVVNGFLAGELLGGRAGQAWVAPVIVTLLAWDRVAAGETGWRGAVGAGLAHALTFLAYWYYGLFAALGLLAFAGRLRGASRRTWGHLLLAGATLLAAVLPFVVVLLAPDSVRPGMELSAGVRSHAAFTGGDAALDQAIEGALWVGWPLWAPLPGVSFDAHLSPLLLLLALVPLVAFRRGSGRWIALAAIGWALAMGPFARGADGAILSGLPLPHAWLAEAFPLYRRLWWPYRAAVLTHVALAVLAGLNLSRLRRELGRAGLPAALLAAALLPLDAARDSVFIPVRTSSAPPAAAAYHRLDGALLTLPVFSDDPTSRAILWQQTFHHLPVLYGMGGHLDGHRPPAIDALVRDNALLATLRAAERGPVDGAVIAPDDVRALRDAGFRWVVADTTSYAPERLPVLERRVLPVVEAVLGPPDIQDASLRAWRITVPAAPATIGAAAGSTP